LPRFDHAHSLFFTALAEQGILGFVALMTVLACYWHEAVKLRPVKDVLIRTLGHTAMGSLIVVVVAGMVNTTLRSEVAIVLCMFLALALAAAKRTISAACHHCTGDVNTGTMMSTVTSRAPERMLSQPLRRIEIS